MIHILLLGSGWFEVCACTQAWTHVLVQILERMDMYSYLILTDLESYTLLLIQDSVIELTTIFTHFWCDAYFGKFACTCDNGFELPTVWMLRVAAHAKFCAYE